MNSNPIEGGNVGMWGSDYDFAGSASSKVKARGQQI